MTEACIFHKVPLNTEEDFLSHMGEQCVIVEVGSDFGGVTPILGNGPQRAGPFDDGSSMDLGTVMPYETKEEADKRRKILGIPITKAPKSATN